jgi:hypothetical protein
MSEQTKPILSFGGIDRSWASSRDESLKERFDSSSPPVGFWGLLIEDKSSRSAISRPRPLHRRRSVGGRLQRFATWRNLLAISSADRAYKESPGRVSDRARWATGRGGRARPCARMECFSMARVNAGTGTCPPTSDAMFFDGASKCGHRDVPAHLRRGPLTWVWADDSFHTLTHWKQRRTLFDHEWCQPIVFNHVADQQGCFGAASRVTVGSKHPP